MKIPKKAWIHTSGTLIGIDPGDNPIAEDHDRFAVKNPHHFGMTDDEMRQVTGREYRDLTSGSQATSMVLEDHLNSKGFYRLHRSTERKQRGGPASHVISISHESYRAKPTDFIEPLKTLKPYLDEIPKEDSFQVHLSGFNKKETARKEHLEASGLPVDDQDTIKLHSMNDVHKYIGIEGGRRSLNPTETPATTSTDIRAALGPKPKDMTAAEFNFYKTIGDSYKPCNFNALLEKIRKCKRRKMLVESGGKRILGMNALQANSHSLISHLNRWNSHLSFEHGGKHTIVRDPRTNKLITTITKGKIGPKAAIDTLTTVRNHLESIGAYVREKGESRGIVTRRQNKEVSDEKKSPIREKTPEELAAKREKLKSIVRQRFGEKKQERIERALAKTQAALAGNSDN